MNNNSKAKAKLLNGKDRSALVAASNPRNPRNIGGKVNRGKPAKTKNRFANEDFA